MLCQFIYTFIFGREGRSWLKEEFFITCLRNRTTLRFDFLHSFMVCAHNSALVSNTHNPEISGFSNCASLWIQNQTESKNEAKTEKKNDVLVD